MRVISRQGLLALLMIQGRGDECVIAPSWEVAKAGEQQVETITKGFDL